MVDNPEVIRLQMEETRSHLTDKLEALENQVAETVQSTTTAVSDTVEAVKETVENVTATVEETVESVSQTFDLKLQTERHPWIVFGGSVALGCLAAHVFGSATERRKGEGNHQTPSWDELQSNSQFREKNRAQPSEPSQQTPTRSAASENGEKSWFRDEFNRVKGLALGALMGVVRDLAAKGLPGPLGQRIAEEVDHLTTSFGGETIHGPVLPTEK